jgi:hypothetical protein
MTDKSTKVHSAVVMVPLALIEGQWQFTSPSDDTEVVTGTRHCTSVDCEYDTHPALPSTPELIAILMDGVDAQYVATLEYEAEPSTDHTAYTFDQADKWAREHVYLCGFGSAEVRDSGGRSLARYEVPDDRGESSNV